MSAETRKLVCFDLGGRELAAPIDEVRETIELRPITPVFRTPPAIAGIASLRGEILAVLDVAYLLGLRPCRRDTASRILVCDVGERSAGILVDRLGVLRDVAETEVQPTPITMPSRESALIEGIISLPEHPLALLSLRRIFEAPDIERFVERTENDERQGASHE